MFLFVAEDGLTELAKTVISDGKREVYTDSLYFKLVKKYFYIWLVFQIVYSEYKQLSVIPS